MHKPTAIASMLLLMMASILLTQTPMLVLAVDACEDQDDACQVQRPSLLQTRKSSPKPVAKTHFASVQFSHPDKESCALPEDGAWVEVHLTGAKPFEMAVRKDSLIAKDLKEKGYWEVQDTSIWGAPGNALDIGGNIGYYTFAMASSGWNVTTFEPMDHNVDFIKATMCKNPSMAANVQLVSIGLGTKNQECSVIEILNNVGNGMVRCDGDTNGGGSPWNPWDFAGSKTRGTFKIRRLDEVLRERKIEKIDFIKLDVEGYECEAMKGAGAESFLKHFQPRLIKSEVWQTQERCIAWDYLTMFENAGYRVGKDDDSACTGPELTGAEKYGGGNFYFCKQ